MMNPGPVFNVQTPRELNIEHATEALNGSLNRDGTSNLKSLALKVLGRNRCLNSDGAGPQNPVQTEAKIEHALTDDAASLAERISIITANGIPSEWAVGYASLCTMQCPPIYGPKAWQQIVNDGGLFLDRWGKQAALLGWRAIDVFGVNAEAPNNRYDGLGLVPILAGRQVAAITNSTARIDCARGVTQTFYRKEQGSGSVAIWTLNQAFSCKHP